MTLKTAALIQRVAGDEMWGFQVALLLKDMPDYLEFLAENGPTGRGLVEFFSAECSGIQGVMLSKLTDRIVEAQHGRGTGNTAIRSFRE